MCLSPGSDVAVVFRRLYLYKVLVPESLCERIRPSSRVHVRYLPLAVVENQAGGGELRGLAFLPALEAVESALPWPEQGFLQRVQTLHQRSRVLVVGVLGGVHGPSEAADKRLGGVSRQHEMRREIEHIWGIRGVVQLSFPI